MRDLKQKWISVFTDLVLQAPIRTHWEDIRCITWSSYGSQTLQAEDKIVVSRHTVGACSELGLLLEAFAHPWQQLVGAVGPQILSWNPYGLVPTPLPASSWMWVLPLWPHHWHMVTITSRRILMNCWHLSNESHSPFGLHW